MTRSEASGADLDIARTITNALRGQQEAGILKGFNVNLKVSKGKVVLTGIVSSARQVNLVEKITVRTDGVTAVDNRLWVRIKDEPRSRKAETPPLESVDTPSAPESKKAAQIYWWIFKTIVNAFLPFGFCDGEPESVQRSSTTEAQSDGRNPPVAEVDEALEAIVRRLEQQRDADKLRGFNIDVQLREGTLTLTGHVSTQRQLEMVESAAAGVQGIERLDNRLHISDASPVVPGNKKAE